MTNFFIPVDSMTVRVTYRGKFGANDTAFAICVGKWDADKLKRDAATSGLSLFTDLICITRPTNWAGLHRLAWPHRGRCIWKAPTLFAARNITRLNIVNIAPSRCEKSILYSATTRRKSFLAEKRRCCSGIVCTQQQCSKMEAEVSDYGIKTRNRCRFIWVRTTLSTGHNQPWEQPYLRQGVAAVKGIPAFTTSVLVTLDYGMETTRERKRHKSLE